MITVSDSGPLIHLAQVNQFNLLKRFFAKIVIPQIVYQEVVSEGKGRFGAQELKEALNAGWIITDKLQGILTVKALSGENLSHKDMLVVAFALEKSADLFLSDDLQVRSIAKEKGLNIVGTLGILTRAKQNSLIPSLKNILDKLINHGFHLDPKGNVYKAALKKVREL